MPRAKNAQKKAVETKVAESCKPAETNKRKPTTTDSSAAPNKKTRKGMKTNAVDAPAKIDEGMEVAHQEAKPNEASVVPEKKIKKGGKAAAEAASREQEVAQVPAVTAGRPKKAAKKAADSGESSAMPRDQKKTVETATALTKKKKGSVVTEAAEQPVIEEEAQQGQEVVKAPTKNKRGSKTAEVKGQLNGTTMPQEEDEDEQVPEKKKKRGRPGTGEAKKQANAEVVPSEVHVGGVPEKKKKGPKVSDKGKQEDLRGSQQQNVVPEKNVKRKGKLTDAKKDEKTAEAEPTPEIPRKEDANEAEAVAEVVNKKKGRKQPAVEKSTEGTEAEEEKGDAEAPTAVESKPKRGRKPAATKKEVNASNSATEQTSSTIYDFTVKDADDNDVSLAKYKGHPVLIVNVASRCGHTQKNYTQLKELYDRYKEQGLRIAAFPCNQFGGQEPGAAADIKRKIAEKFRFEPDFYAKISVNGAAADPLYKFLKSEQGNNEAIKWNFAKFLVDKDGYVVKRYLPKIQPKELTGDIETLLGGGKL